MNKGHIYFEIQADDPARAVHFYSQVFGWKFGEIPDCLCLTGVSKLAGREVDCCSGLPRLRRRRAARMRSCVRLRLKISTRLRKPLSKSGESSPCPNLLCRIPAGRGISWTRKEIHSESFRWIRTQSINLRIAGMRSKNPHFSQRLGEVGHPVAE